MPKIECVTVCKSYADFLCWTLPFNKSMFDNMVVVTSTDDTKTQKLCEYHNVKCVKVQCEEEFSKGELINEGLEHLDGDEWVVHIDSDIYLPPHFRQVVNKCLLDTNSIYGIDRVMCTSFREWIKFLMEPKLQYENNTFIFQPPFPLGVRLAIKAYDYWTPIGFFQCWHQGSKQLTYPTEHKLYARGDLQFSLMFEKENRRFLPEIYGIHLETLVDGKSMGANWNGRQTPIFGQEMLDEVVN